MVQYDEVPAGQFPFMFILNDEKRKDTRQHLLLKARVEVRVDGLITWDETATVVDVSLLGAGLALKRAVKPGHIVSLSMTMPRDLRGFDFRKEKYRIWGLVRRCIKKQDGSDEPRYAVGVAFIGKTPPPEYTADPTQKFDLIEGGRGEGFWTVAAVKPGEQKVPVYSQVRRQSRLEIPEEVTLELMDENGSTGAAETTVTLNISRTGAAVYSQLDAEIGSFVRMSSTRSDISLISIVRGKNVGHAGVSRINLEFIDQTYPVDLIT